METPFPSDPQQVFDKLRALSVRASDPAPLSSEEQIIAAEARFGIVFPPSFRTWLRQYADIPLFTYEFLQLTDPDGPTGIDRGERLARKAGLPARLFPFLRDGHNYFCFDTSSWGPEYRVVFWSGDTKAVEEAWPHFLAWVERCWINEMLNPDRIEDEDTAVEADPVSDPNDPLLAALFGKQHRRRFVG